MNKKLKEKRQIGKWRSWETTEGVIRAPHRSMMRAMGLTDDYINAPFIGVASTHNEVTPCNSGNSPTKSETKSALQIDAAISTFSLLIFNCSEIKLASFCILCVLS